MAQSEALTCLENAFNIMSDTYWQTLEQRRRDLGIGYPALGERAGISVQTLKRIFSGKANNPTLQSLQAICRVLGLQLIIDGSMIKTHAKKSVQELREVAAMEKAKRIVKLVQGTSALEAQAVGISSVRDMVSRTVNELLAGSSRKLWAP